MAPLLPAESEEYPDVPEEPVEPGEPVELPLGDEGLVVEDEEPGDDVSVALSVLRLQAPSVSTADNTTTTMAADLILDAYISVSF